MNSVSVTRTVRKYIKIATRYVHGYRCVDPLFKYQFMAWQLKILNGLSRGKGLGEWMSFRNQPNSVKQVMLCIHAISHTVR